MPMNGPTGHRLRPLESVVGHLWISVNPTPSRTEVVPIAFLVVFILELKADQGQSRMTQVMRTILQDGILHLFDMSGFCIAILFFTIVGKVTFFHSLVERYVLTSQYPSLPFLLITTMVYNAFRLGWRLTWTLWFDTRDDSTFHLWGYPFGRPPRFSCPGWGGNHLPQLKTVVHASMLSRISFLRRDPNLSFPQSLLCLLILQCRPGRPGRPILFPEKKEAKGHYRSWHAKGTNRANNGLF